MDSPAPKAPEPQGLLFSTHTPSPQMVHPPFPVSECVCPTCQYYKAAFVAYQFDCLSPNVDMFAMYQSMSPYAPVFADRTNENQTNLLSTNALEQFENSIGNLAHVATTQSGRSMIQSVMKLQHADKIQIIFDELCAAAETVMLDVHGCHVVRSLMEVIDDGQVAKLVNCLSEILVLNMCTVSQYTRKILQTLFEKHSHHMGLQTIVEMLGKNARYLAATQQGCICLMRVYERCNEEQKEQLIASLLPIFEELSCDPYGNYVVQCVLENADKGAATKYVLECLNGKLLKMSCDKFASNVMEKVIRCVQGTSVRRIVLDELIFNPAALQQMVQDPFGNFVIQSIIETCGFANEFKKISDRLRHVLPNSAYGHKIEARLRAKRFAPPTQRSQGRHRQAVHVN